MSGKIFGWKNVMYIILYICTYIKMNVYLQELKLMSMDKLQDRKNNVSPPTSPDSLQRHDG